MNYKNYTQLSKVAKDYGLKTPWYCFEAKRLFDDIETFLEICKRIEMAELRLEEIVKTTKKEL